jgi:DNA-binding transcriptional MerR regulator
MALKIGELARRTGLTVRTLHHYDAIGLLKPSARSDAGYRLYDRNDVARLHQVQALRRLGLSLADIGALMAGNGLPLPVVIDQQLRALDRQIAEASRLRERLALLRGALADGTEPDLADWLTTLESMSMYDRYFTQDELARLPYVGNDAARRAEWKALASMVRDMLARGVTPAMAEAQIAARRWIGMLEEDTGGDPRLVAKLNRMFAEQPAFREETGIEPAMVEFVYAALAEQRLALYAKYLTPAELAHMREHYPREARGWPELIAQVRACMDDGTPPADPRATVLAARWLAMFRAFAGDDPATQARIREAHEKEPELLHGTWVDAALLAYLREAMAAMAPAAA